MARPRKTQTASRPTTTGARVIGYLRVSTDEQGQSGAGLDAQRATITAAAATRGWDVEFMTEVASGGKDDRPVLREVLARLAAGEADVLAVAKLDRLSRSVRTVLDTVDLATSGGWGLVMLDSGADLTTAAGRGVVSMLASVAEMERGLISERTKAALATRKAAGIKLGRPSGLPTEVRVRIAEARHAKATLQRIADDLNADGVPTSRGGSMWRASSVQAVLIADGLR